MPPTDFDVMPMNRMGDISTGVRASKPLERGRRNINGNRCGPSRLSCICSDVPQSRLTARMPAPPTIAHLKTHGLDGLFVTCANAACQRSAPFTFAALGLRIVDYGSI
jgi:hypothetical protein